MPADVDQATRSRMMAGIRSSNTKPELQLRRNLHKLGFRYRINVKSLPGSPDIVLPRYKAAILVHGCYWHGHNCHLFKLPATRRDFWQQKIAENRARDQRNEAALRASGWRIMRVWECALKGKYRLPQEVVSGRLIDWIHSKSPNTEIIGNSDADGTG